MAIQRYTGGTGVRAQRLSPGAEAPSMLQSLLGLGSSLVNAAQDFSFIAKRRADRKKAESASLRNELLLPMDDTLRDLAKETRDDPDAWAQRSDEILKGWMTDWDSRVEADELLSGDRDRLMAQALDLQSTSTRAIGQEYERRSEDQKTLSAELAFARQQAGMMTVGALLASDDPQEQALGARKLENMRAAYFDPQGPAMSQGPAAVALRWHELEGAVDRSVITSMAMRKMGAGGDPSAIINALRGQGTAASLESGTFGIATRSGMRFGGRLGLEDAWRLADDIERTWNAEQRRRAQAEKVAADEGGDAARSGLLGIRDAFRRNEIDAGTMERLVLAAGGTPTQALKIASEPGAPTQEQSAWLAANRQSFDEMLDKVELGANGAVDGFIALSNTVNDWEGNELVSADQAADLRGRIRGRRDKHADLMGGPLTPANTVERLTAKLKKNIGGAGSSEVGARELYTRTVGAFANPDPSVRVQNVIASGGDLVSDGVRRGDILAAYEMAVRAGVDPMDAFNLANASLYAGGNGQLLRFVEAHSRGDGVAGAQKILAEQPDVFIGFFPNVAAQSAKIARTPTGSIDVRGTEEAVWAEVESRAQTRTGQGPLWGRRPPSPADIMGSFRPHELVLMDWLAEVEAFQQHVPQPSEREIAERGKMEADRMKRQQEAAANAPL